MVTDDLEASEEETEGEDPIDSEDEEITDQRFKRPKFSTSSVPGVFLGWEFQAGGKFKDVYVVANLQDLRRGKSKPRIDRVMKIYHDQDEGFIFPMRNIYDHLTRTVGHNKHPSSTPVAPQWHPSSTPVAPQ